MERIPLFKVFMAPGVGAAVQRVADTGYVGEGPEVAAFEAEFQAHLESKGRKLPAPPLMVNSCTAALDLAYELIGLGHEHGQVVQTTPLTCLATNLPLLHRGCKIEWFDCSSDSGLARLDSTCNRPKPDCQVVVAWSGHIPSIEERAKVPLVLDLAHTPAPLEYPLEEAYLCYSFQAIKHLTTGDGGCLVCPDPFTYERAKLLRWYGLDRRLGADFRCAQDVKCPGFKYHMNDVTAAIGRVNLKHLPAILEKHRKNAKSLHVVVSEYSRHFSCINYDASSAYWIFTLTVRENRAGLMKHLSARGIDSSLVHSRNDFHSCFSRYRAHLPGVTRFQDHQLSIPCGWWLSDSDVGRIIDGLVSWVKCQ